MAVNSSRQDEQTAHLSKRETIVRLFSYLKNYKLQVIITLLLMVITVGISLVNPLLIKKAIDELIPNKDMNGLLKLGVFTLTINVVFMFTVKLRMYIMAYVSNHILRDIREELYVHMQTLAFTFFDGRPTGKILARIIGDINSLKRVFTNAVITLIPGICTIIGVLVIMLKEDIVLGLLSLCTLPIMLVGLIIINKICHEKWQVFRKKSSNLNAYTHEDISGMAVVQSYAAEEETAKNFEGLVDEQYESFKSAVKVNDFFMPIVDICWGVSACMLYLGGTKLLGIGSVSVGTLAAFGTYIGMFWEPVANISGFYNQVITNITAAERIFEVLDTPADIADKEGAIILPDIEGAVSFEHVSFTYDEGTEEETHVLTDVSFDVKPGEKIALVGPTGAGKTTIVNLLSRFYDIQEGSVKVDGYDVRNVTIKSLRSQMGVMTQENFIFSGTIKDNIRYGKLDATDEDIINAAKAVNAHEFIMSLEKGYDTELGGDGTSLSVGQRQLIAFARTCVSMPKILILDEATSSIDTKTEKEVQKGIEGLLEGRTSFIIAHRLSTIQNADRIFVVDNEGIVESGSPRELIDKRGAYYKLYMAQFEEIA